MTGRQPVEPSAFSHFLATNYQRDPDYVVLTPGGEVLAAKWHRPAARTVTGVALAQHTLMYHVGGSTSVAKFVHGRCVGTTARHRSLTFSPRDEPSEWVRGGVCEMMHVYIAPSLIERYTDENLTLQPRPRSILYSPPRILGCRAISCCYRANSKYFEAAGGSPMPSS
jgi:AraC family transcriptional regulator